MRIQKHFPALVALALAGAILPVSLPAQDKDKSSHEKMAAHMDPYMRGSADENALIKEVRHNLLMLPRYGVFDDIGFTVNGGTVTLMGQTTQPVLKGDAEKTVRRIPGVTNVVNNLEVAPLSPNDDRIRIAAYRAIYGDASLSARYAYNSTQSIHIIVKNGNIRLEGNVATQADKNVAGIRANGVHGAFHVENDLQVES